MAPDERERLYGQFDHVRMYGVDFADRLTEAAGLLAELADYPGTLSSEDVARFAVQDTSPVSKGEIYLARQAG